MFSYSVKTTPTTTTTFLCLNFSIETKIKTLFPISFSVYQKKQIGTLGTRILFPYHCRKIFKTYK